MPTDENGGRTAFERLRSHYEDVDLLCPECGYEDDEGSWTAKSAPHRILYRHVCPSCGAIRTRTLATDEE